MKKSTYLKIVKAFILLSPIPFGCVGKVFSPLFYMSLLLISYFGFSVNERKRSTDTRSVLFAFQGKIKLVMLLFFAFLLFQLLPLPSFLVKLISPETAGHAAILNGKLPGFISISLVPIETFFFAMRMAVLFLFFFSFIGIKFKKKELVSLSMTLVLSVSIQGLFGLIKYSMGNYKFFLFFKTVIDDPTKEFLTGTLGNPNHFSFYIEMVFPILVALFFLQINLFGSGGSLKDNFLSAFNADRKVILTFILIPFLGMIVVLTGARSGIITLLISFFIFAMLAIYLRRSRAIRKKLKIIFISLSLLLVFVGVKNTTDKFMKGDYFSNAGRFLRWPNTIDMFADHPVFGTGFGTYKYAFYLYDTDNTGIWSTNAHNEYLENLAEGGMIGSIIFLLLIGTMVFSISKMWRARKHPDIKILGIGILTSIFAAFFHSIFDFSLRIPSNSFVLILIFGLGIQISTYRKEFMTNGRPIRNSGKNSHSQSSGGLK